MNSTRLDLQNSTGPWRGAATVGIVVIGRNEGERLQRALSSIAMKGAGVLYVDSGSCDGSVALARAMGVAVHCLDPARPFSAARARAEGVAKLLERAPDIRFIQFLDGDCELMPGWLPHAVAYLRRHAEVAVVCGKLMEKTVDGSIFNRINALRWSAALTGDIDACGGIFLIRRTVYESAGGFNPLLVTGEESELCRRVRGLGHRIVRLDDMMACHDSDLVRFSDWWKRAVWGGYGDAMEYEILSGNVTARRRRETRSVFLWAFILPSLFMAGAIAGVLWSPGWLAVPAICVLGYCALVARIAKQRRQQGDSLGDAVLFAAFTVLRKLPYGIGFLRGRLNPRTGGCGVDPHGTEESKASM